MKGTLLLVVLLIFSSCEMSVEQDIRYIEHLLDVELKDGYQIKNKQYDFTIGDSIKSFDIVFDDSTFDLFFYEVESIFIPIDKTLIDKKNLDYYKNFDFGDTRVHFSINLKEKTLHYTYADL